jgi:uncharacterized protein YidB (DUF937 family)
MGLLDQILGGGSGSSDRPSGLDAILLAILGLNKTQQSSEQSSQTAAAGHGGISETLRRGLGGIFGGGEGGFLSNALADLVGSFQQRGLGDIAQSWVSRGANKPVSPQEVEQALGAEKVNSLSQRAGVPREEVLSTLSKKLPEAVDQLTPEGRLPSRDDATG